MRKLYLKLFFIEILLMGTLFISCNQNQKENKTEQAENLNASKTPPSGIKQSDLIEKIYIPKEKITTQWDTTIQRNNLKILLENSYLDSYVSNEFEKNGEMYLGHYRDSEKHLVISLPGTTLVDTTFRKNDFIPYAGSDFLNVAVFKEYRFERFRNDTVVFHGVFSHPNSDWRFVFQHYFDVNKGKFDLKKMTETAP